MENQFVVRNGFVSESECSVCGVRIHAWCGASLKVAEEAHQCHPLDVPVAGRVLDFASVPGGHARDTSYWLSKAS